MIPIKILILAANPKGSDHLRLDEEVREIKAVLEQSQFRDEFVVLQEWAVRVDDLQKLLHNHAPQIVHFSGHGTGADGLVLENELGREQPVSTQALTGLFKLFPSVQCVCLNACYSEVQAEEICKYIPCVVGMNQAIGDKAAIQFAKGFYRALGAHRSFEEAYEFGLNAINLQNIPDASIPAFKSNQLQESPAHTLFPAAAPADLTPLLETHLINPNASVSSSDASNRANQSFQAPSPQSQSFGNITIGGSNNPFNAIQSGGNVNLSQRSTQSSGGNPDLEAALALLVSLQQEVAVTDALTSFAKKDTGSKIMMLQEELQKPEPDKGFVKEVVEALKQGLHGVLTLAEPVTQVAGLVAKALVFMS